MLKGPVEFDKNVVRRMVFEEPFITPVCTLGPYSDLSLMTDKWKLKAHFMNKHKSSSMH